MRLFRTFFITLILLSSTVLHASDDLMDAGRAASMDMMLDNAIRRGLIAGGVVAVGNRHGLLYSTSRTGPAVAPDTPSLSERTLFDVASLTKVIATAPAVMMLQQQGSISLMDPITRWFPEFSGTGREEITLLNLLTHTSGLDDIDLPPEEPLNTVIAKAASQKQWKIPGDRFRYADINFILLGELVRRVSGIPLDRYCLEHIFAPIGMADTQFLPPTGMMADIAPTSTRTGALQAGIVQDLNARRLGGVAGHAGLFSNASDLARFAAMILNQGSRSPAGLFHPRVVAQMTAPYFYSNGKIIRGLGWDINSPFSAPRGDYFSEMSFGHTGYSGSSIWIDPELDLFVILLTIRLDFNDIRQLNRLRRDISSLAVSIFSTPRMTGELLDLPQLP